MGSRYFLHFFIIGKWQRDLLMIARIVCNRNNHPNARIRFHASNEIFKPIFCDNNIPWNE